MATKRKAESQVLIGGLMGLNLAGRVMLKRDRPTSFREEAR